MAWVSVGDLHSLFMFFLVATSSNIVGAGHHVRDMHYMKDNKFILHYPRHISTDLDCPGRYVLR